MAARMDRDEVFLELTRSICPRCKRVIDAEVNARDNRVVLRKRCPEHGTFEALVSSDAEAYVAQQRLNKPGTLPLALQTDVHDGCPLDCGICPQHKQHSCLGIIEVVAMARERGIRIVMINTNGIKLAADRRFVRELAALGAHVYLQFDGLEEATHIAMRGRDLRAIKARALDHCAREGVRVTLVAAVDRDVNDHEIGAIVRTGVEHPAVNSVVFQPVTHSGRHPAFDPLQRLTNADVIAACGEQLPEWFRPSDFVPVPCCFPTCRSMSYALVDDGQLIPFTRMLEIEDQLDYLANRVTPDRALRGALEQMFSSSATPGAERALLACESCGIDLPGALDDLRGKVFMIVVQDFQDP